MKSSRPDGRFRTTDVPQMFPGCSATPSTRSTWRVLHVAMHTHTHTKKDSLKNNLRAPHWPRLMEISRARRTRLCALATFHHFSAISAAFRTSTTPNLDKCIPRKHAIHARRPTVRAHVLKVIDEGLTEFSLFIRLVYLWLAAAGRLLSCSEGVIPLKKQPRHGFRDARRKPRDVHPFHRVGSISGTSSPTPAQKEADQRSYFPSCRLRLISAVRSGVRVRACICVRVCARVCVDRCRGWKRVRCAVDADSGPINQRRIEYSHGSANRVEERAAAVAWCRTRQSKRVCCFAEQFKGEEHLIFPLMSQLGFDCSTPSPRSQRAPVRIAAGF